MLLRCIWWTGMTTNSMRNTWIDKHIVKTDQSSCSVTYRWTRTDLARIRAKGLSDDSEGFTGQWIWISTWLRRHKKTIDPPICWYHKSTCQHRPFTKMSQRRRRTALLYGGGIRPYKQCLFSRGKGQSPLHQREPFSRNRFEVFSKVSRHPSLMKDSIRALLLAQKWPQIVEKHNSGWCSFSFQFI